METTSDRSELPVFPATAPPVFDDRTAPEFRGPESGFFDNQVAVADDAPALHRLLGFAGRDPAWDTAAHSHGAVNHIPGFPDRRTSAPC